MQRFLGIILFFIFIVGCKSDEPGHILDEKKMTDLLLNLHLAEGYLSSWTSDSSQRRSGDVIEGIYQHYDTDSAIVRESLEYYAKQPQVLNQIYRDVDIQLKAMETEVREVEEKKYRKIFVKDSLRRDFVADSLLKIKTDSLNYENSKYMLYWKNPDSIELKPKAWDWNKETVIPKRYFNFSDSLILNDSTILKQNILNKDSVLNQDSTANKTVVPKKELLKPTLQGAPTN